MSAATLLGVYLAADNLAKKRNQVVGAENDYYITLEQLQVIIEQIEHALEGK